MSNTIKLIVSLVLPQLAGGIGALFTAPAIPGWYEGLVKPALTPPSWVFGPMWTLLYILMGIALYLVWRMPADSYSNVLKNIGVRMWRLVGMWFFGIQLALNVFWSILFFGLQSPGVALVEIVFLLVAIVATIFAFAKVSRLAAWLLVPYLLWVSFAVYLNYAIWALN